MSTQPEALRLADELAKCWGDSRIDQTIAELRRLHKANAELLADFKEAREALQYANENPSGGISDTIWMMHRPETLFDFMDAAIAKAKEGV